MSRPAADPRTGILFVLLTTFFFGCMDACAKALASDHDAFMVVWARYAGQVAGAALFFAPTLLRRLRTDRLAAQIGRSALLFGATLCFFSAFAVMPLADVLAVAQTAPLAITALAALLLAERVGPYRWAGVAAGFIGALVIIRPGFSDVGAAGLLPLVGALFFAAYSVATRFLGDQEDPWTTFLYTGLVGAAGATLFLPWVWSAPSLSEAPLWIGVGMFGALGQATLIFAFQYAPASLLAPFFYSGLLWAALFGLVFFGDAPGVYTALGASLIVGAGLFVRWREQRAAARAQ